jgi:hypothetical protein
LTTRSSLRDISASFEERAHALEMAQHTRTHQCSPAIHIHVCDVSASLEERAHPVETARSARSHLEHRHPTLLSLRKIYASFD